MFATICLVLKKNCVNANNPEKYRSNILNPNGKHTNIIQQRKYLQYVKVLSNRPQRNTENKPAALQGILWQRTIFSVKWRVCYV